MTKYAIIADLGHGFPTKDITRDDRCIDIIEAKSPQAARKQFRAWWTDYSDTPIKATRIG